MDGWGFNFCTHQPVFQPFYPVLSWISFHSCRKLCELFKSGSGYRSTRPPESLELWRKAQPGANDICLSRLGDAIQLSSYQLCHRFYEWRWCGEGSRVLRETPMTHFHEVPYLVPYASWRVLQVEHEQHGSIRAFSMVMCWNIPRGIAYIPIHYLRSVLDPRSC